MTASHGDSEPGSPSLTTPAPEAGGAVAFKFHTVARAFAGELRKLTQPERSAYSGPGLARASLRPRTCWTY